MHQLQTYFKPIYLKFTYPPVLTLLLVLIAVVTILNSCSSLLEPILVAIVISYLLGGLVTKLERRKFSHFMAVLFIYCTTLGLVLFAFFWLFPMLGHQAATLFSELPNMLVKGQQWVADLQARYPEILSEDQFTQVLVQFNSFLTKVGPQLLSTSVSSISGIFTILIYAVIVPLLVYFFLMDKKVILNWTKQFLPKNRQLLDNVWSDMHTQIANYVRGRVIEMIIVGVVCYLLFVITGLNFSVLLATLVAVSVIVPYVGAVAATIPVLIIAFLQLGWTSTLGYFTLIYAIIITVDANVLVPLLFSGAVRVHPIAIIFSLLFFGSIWGFWGVFFAIPLAALVKSVIYNIQHAEEIAAKS